MQLPKSTLWGLVLLCCQSQVLTKSFGGIASDGLAGLAPFPEPCHYTR